MLAIKKESLLVYQVVVSETLLEDSEQVLDWVERREIGGGEDVADIEELKKLDRVLGSVVGRVVHVKNNFFHIDDSFSS